MRHISCPQAVRGDKRHTHNYLAQHPMISNLLWLQTNSVLEVPGGLLGRGDICGVEQIFFPYLVTICIFSCGRQAGREVKGPGFGVDASGCQATLSLSSCVTLGKFTSPLSPGFLLCQLWIIVLHQFRTYFISSL